MTRSTSIELCKGIVLTETTTTSEHVPSSASRAESKEIAEEGHATIGQDENTSKYPTGLRFWLVMLSLGAALIICAIDQNIVATAVPSITNEFHTIADVGWYASAFRLAQCASQFLFGKLYANFSIKKTYVSVILVFVLGSILCATAVSSTMFVIGRAVTGLGAAGCVAGVLVILVNSTSLAKRPLWLSMYGLVEGLAVVSGPLLGGVITEYANWRYCFWINLPMAAITLLLTMFFIHDSPKSVAIASLSTKEKLARLDLLSTCLFLPALTSLFLAFAWGGTRYAWNSGTIAGLFVTFGVLILAFAYNQYRKGDRAALPPRVLSQRSVIAGLIYMICTNAAGNTLEYYLPIYYQSVHNYSPAQSGYILLSILVLAIIGCLFEGIFTSELGYYTPFISIASTLTPVATGLISTFGVETSLGRLVGYNAFWGFAYGIGFAVPQTAVQTVLSVDDVPLGLAIMLFAQSFGPAIGYAIAQVLFLNQLSGRLLGLLPGVDLSEILNTGLTQLVAQAPADQADGVVAAISQSLKPVWYMVVGFACATMIGSLLMEWRSVKKKQPEVREDDHND